MSDILIAHPDAKHLRAVSADLMRGLSKLNLKATSEKIQSIPPYAFSAFLLIRLRMEAKGLFKQIIIMLVSTTLELHSPS